MTYSNKDFIHFHVHSFYSNFDGLSDPYEIAIQARKMGFTGMALTDHGNMMGIVKWIKACKATKDKKGNDISYPPIKAIIGQEFYFSRKMDLGQREEKKDQELIKKYQPEGRRGNYHLNLFCLNFEGYKNLCYLSQKAFTNGFYYDGRIDLNLLSQHTDGVMCGSACLNSIINANLVYGHYDRAKKICSIFKDLFKDNFFLEVMYHGIMEEKEIIPMIFKLSKELDIPVICTNDMHYIFKEQGKAHELLLCMSQQKCIKDPNRLRFGHHEFYLKSAEEMSKIFGNEPKCFTNSIMMAERIDTKDIEENLFGGMRLPKFDIPEQYKNTYEYLRDLAWDGMKRIGWDKSKDHVEALKKELQDVFIAKENNNYDFSTYFLIVRDYIQKARENGTLLGCGRGSGYSSILLRCLGITYGIDPIKYGLLWERFLGFSNQRFLKASDFGFKEDILQNFADIEEDDVDEEREIEDDLGGI